MKNQSRRISLLLAAVAAAALLGSCNLFEPVPRYRIVEPEAVVPKNFLYNPDQSYNEWMDTPQRVHYHEVAIESIFHDHPFEDFRYELHDIPADMKTVSIDALGQTRRQLLWALAHDNNLKMTLLTTRGGKPSVVSVRWRGNRSTNVRGSLDR